MTESFLHYIWQFQYFDKTDLITTEGEVIQVFHPGIKNIHAGPDFSDARIKIGALEWRGSVEIHINATGWVEHHHQTDAAYEKVILHVVWTDDKIIRRGDGSVMPTLVLKNRVDPALWNRYRRLITAGEEIPCSHSLHKISPVITLSMLDRTLLQRLESKAGIVLGLLEKNKNDWDETAYQLLARNFGFKVNAEPFQQLATALPYKVIMKHANRQDQVEALLFGVAGFLENVKEDAYTSALIQEYSVLSRKYNLEQKMLHKTQWRFLRLRPANFPTLRLAQFASFLITSKNLFATLSHSTYKQLKEWLSIEQSDYWKHHYQFGKAVKTVPSLGAGSIHTILINTVTPLLVAYGRKQDDQQYVDRAVNLLQQIPAEKNSITRLYASLGIDVKTAFDSQALIELYSFFCKKRRCLECSIGASLIKPA
ncbi:MAG: DUF2851 family protein [Cyclobacteriaceae bacterium]